MVMFLAWAVLSVRPIARIMKQKNLILNSCPMTSLFYDITLLHRCYTNQFSQPYFRMCISLSQLIMDIGIAVFARLRSLNVITSYLHSRHPWGERQHCVCG